MEKLISHSYHTGGMSCDYCVSAVKLKLSSVPGVTFVKVNQDKKEAEIISSQKIETETLRRAFKNTYYTISELGAKSTSQY